MRRRQNGFRGRKKSKHSTERDHGQDQADNINEGGVRQHHERDVSVIQKR